MHQSAGSASESKELGRMFPANNCTGSFSYDLNARIQSGTNSPVSRGAMRSRHTTNSHARLGVLIGLCMLVCPLVRVAIARLVLGMRSNLLPLIFLQKVLGPHP